MPFPDTADSPPPSDRPARATPPERSRGVRSNPGAGCTVAPSKTLTNVRQSTTADHQRQQYFEVCALVARSLQQAGANRFADVLQRITCYRQLLPRRKVSGLTRPASSSRAATVDHL